MNVNKDFWLSNKIIKKANPQKILEMLEKFLEIILEEIYNFDNFSIEIIFNFLEYSDLVSEKKEHTIYKQCFVKKRSGGRYKENLCSLLIGGFCKRWLKRWLIVSEDGVMYSQGPSGVKVNYH